MALAPVGRRVGGGARIAIFWRISAVFDPICRGPGAIFPANETRADFPGAGIAARGPRAGHHGRRSPVRGPRSGRFGPWSPGRGRASFTGLIAHSWPASGH